MTFPPSSSQSIRPTNQSRPQRGLPPIAHPNASKYYDNLILGDSVVKRISYKLFIKGQSTLKIALSGKGTRDIHHFVNETLQLDKESKNIFIHVGTNGLNNGISPPKVIEMMNSLTFSIKHKFPNSKIILSSVLSRQNNLSFNSQMKSYNDLLQQFCAENNFVFCDNSNLCHASYYIEDGVHLNSTKGIQLLVNNMNKSVGNLIQPKNLDTFTFSRHQLNENTNRYKHNGHQTDLRFGFRANYIVKEYE